MIVRAPYSLVSWSDSLFDSDLLFFLFFFTEKMFPVGRPKGQHSAPRGGPPRSWTNAELTEALQHVWNKKMTTSQASRIFGIPYNSLLMYVRGKYGKSLKLEQLKKECFGDINGPLDLLHFGSISNNNNSSNKNNNNNNSNNNGGTNNSGNNKNNNNGSSNGGSGNPPPAPCGNPPPEPADLMLGPPGFNPPAFPAPNFFPDFGSTFPLGMDMMHLMQQQHQQMSMSAAEKHQYMGLDMVVGSGGQSQSSAALDYAMKSPAACSLSDSTEPQAVGVDGDARDDDARDDEDDDDEEDDELMDDDGRADDDEDEDDAVGAVAVDFSSKSGDRDAGVETGGGGGGDDDDDDDEDDEDDDADERLSDPGADDDKDKERQD